MGDHVTGTDLWDWRSTRWDDCNGALVGLRLVSPTHVECVVASGRYDGETLLWTERSMPPWIFKELQATSLAAGRVQDGKLCSISAGEKARIVATARGDRKGCPDPQTPAPVLTFASDEDGSVCVTDPAASEKLAWIGTYLHWDWAIFPLVADRKVTHRGSRGYKDAVSGPAWVAAVTAFFEEWPADNLGLACGRAGSPVVIDIDPQNGGSIDAAQRFFDCDLTHTWRVRTPSGGTHLYFFDTADPRCASVDSGRFDGLPGVEIKSVGRHVVLPPSAAKGATYVWENMTGPLTALPDQMRAAASEARKQTNPFKDVIPDPFAFRPPVEPILDAVRSAGTGRRNEVLHDAAGVIIASTPIMELQELVLALKNAGLDCGLGEPEVNKTIRSALDYRLDRSIAESISL